MHTEDKKLLNDHLLAFALSGRLNRKLKLPILQISYEYLIVALGLQLHYEKVNSFLQFTGLYPVNFLLFYIFTAAVKSQETYTLLKHRSRACQRGLNIRRLGQTTQSKLWRKHGEHCGTSKKATLCSLSQILL